MTKKMVLFDIDGTLLNASGVGSRAFSKALETVLGIPDALRHIRLDGQTDFLILEKALEHAGRPPQIDPAMAMALYDAYVDFLHQELGRADSTYRVLGGVRELLEALNDQPDILLGLATGNLERGAWAKLKPGNLDRYFGFGGFGSDARERFELIRIAVERGRRLNDDAPPASVIVIGDTPQDIIHGHRAGAAVIAVATGGYSKTELNEYHPELVLDSLEPATPVLDFVAAR